LFGHLERFSNGGHERILDDYSEKTLAQPAGPLVRLIAWAEA
jgi:hypothetical protein